MAAPQNDDNRRLLVERPSPLSQLLLLVVGALSLILALFLLVSPDLTGPGIVALLFSLFLGLRITLQVYGSEFWLTQHTVGQRVGIIARRTSEVELTDIRNIQVSQGVIQRLLGIGDVRFSSAGQSDIEVAFVGVQAPEQIAEIVRRQRRKLDATPRS